MQIASFTLAVLSLIQFNTAPIDTPVSEKSLNVVSSFLNYPEKAGSSFTFPDRSVEAYQAQELDKQRELERVEAEKAETARLLAESQKNVLTPPKVAQPANISGDDNAYKLFIYNKESGNNPARYNSSGCLGLGQACPASKLLKVCPDINDYACQDAWFTNYAISRYGSWAGAYQFWLGHHWW